MPEKLSSWCSWMLVCASGWYHIVNGSEMALNTTSLPAVSRAPAELLLLRSFLIYSILFYFLNLSMGLVPPFPIMATRMSLCIWEEHMVRHSGHNRGALLGGRQHLQAPVACKQTYGGRAVNVTSKWQIYIPGQETSLVAGCSLGSGLNHCARTQQCSAVCSLNAGI